MDNNQNNNKLIGKYIYFYLKDKDKNDLIYVREYIRIKHDKTTDVDVDVSVNIVNYSNLLIKLNNTTTEFNIHEFIVDFESLCDIREYIWEDYYDYLEDNDIEYDIKQFNPIAKIVRYKIEYFAEKYNLISSVIKGNKFDEKTLKKLKKNSCLFKQNVLGGHIKPNKMI